MGAPMPKPMRDTPNAPKPLQVPKPPPIPRWDGSPVLTLFCLPGKPHQPPLGAVRREDNQPEGTTLNRIRTTIAALAAATTAGLTALALTNAGGSVQVRSIGTGTALNKRWIFVP